MFRRNPAHTGYSDSNGPLTNQTLWSYSTGGSVESSPSVADGVVYVGSYDGHVYALNASSGTQLWNYTTGNRVPSSPCIANGIVYFGSFDNNIYALNASTGQKLWNYPTQLVVYSSPCVYNDVVYVGSVDGNVYALDAISGTQLWNYTTLGTIWCSPAVDNGIIYIGSDDHNLYALNASSGAKIWNYTTGNLVESSPCVLNGIVYFGSHDSNVYALNAVSGIQIWNFSATSGLISSPSIANGVVYIGSYDSYVYALDASSGVKLWSFKAGSPIFSSPCVTDDVVYVGSWDHNIYALSTNTGFKIWSYSTGNAIYSSPCIDNGIVYVGSMDGKVYAFGELFTLTMLTAGNGSVSPNNSTFSAGSWVDLKALNAVGWTFSGWSGDASGNGNTTIVMDANKTVTATFTQDVYTLRMVTFGQGSVLPGNSSFLSGSVVDLKAINAVGWYFAGWSGDSTGTNNATLVMDSNKTVVAVFTQAIYTLKMNTVGQGSVLPGNSSFVSGSVVDLKAMNKVGWSFSGWSDDASGSANTTILMNSNKTVTATFTQANYTLRMITFGQGTLLPGNTTFPSGSLVDLKAINAVGWSFSGWSGDVTGKDNTTIVMNSDKMVVAIFAQNVYTLNMFTVGQGSVLPDNSSFPSGSTVDLKAITAFGWSFSGWMVDATGTANTTITMNSNKTVVAVFTQDVFTLNMITIGNGSVLPGNTTFSAGSLVDLKAVNAAGWSFSGWSGDASGNYNTTIVMNSNKTITTIFTQNTYSLKMITFGQGTISPGNTTYLSGSIVELKAMNSAGWSFAGWSGDASGANNATIVMDSDKIVVAVFTQQIYSLKMVTVGRGSVVPGNSSYASGSVVDLKAMTAKGWTFSGWSGDVSGNGNTTIVMDSNKTVTANFTKTSYTLTIITVGYGKVSPYNVTFSAGTHVYLKATSASGWSFAGWSGDASGRRNTISIIMNDNITITALFTRIHHR